MLYLEDGSPEIVEEHVGGQRPLEVVAVCVLKGLLVLFLFGFRSVHLAVGLGGGSVFARHLLIGAGVGTGSFFLASLRFVLGTGCRLLRRF